jgi:hypothetical protein
MPRTIPPVLSDLNRGGVREEGNLLIEAVSLLVQRQRETESWIAEQIWQAEERTAAAERLAAEFESRLAGIEEQLARLLYEVEPLRGDAAIDERLERLRVQVQSLRSSSDGRIPRTTPAFAAPSGLAQSPPQTAPGRDVAASYGSELESAGPAESARPVDVGEPRSEERRGPSGRPAAEPRARAASASGQGVGFWELLGARPQDRFGLLLIGAGAVAVLYAILTQLRFG